MKIGANINLDNRTIGGSFNLTKEEGEDDFFSNLFSKNDKEIEDLIDDEEYAFVFSEESAKVLSRTKN